MNFGKTSSNFFRGKTLKSFYQNKYSCKFFSSNLNRFSTKNFITFSNLFFTASIQRLIISSRSISGTQASKLLVGEGVNKGENLDASCNANLDKICDGVNSLAEALLLAKSKFFYYFNLP